MKRLFLALTFTDPVKDALVSIQPKVGAGLRPISRQGLHLTLCFIGKAEIEWVYQALSPLQAQPFSLLLKGVGQHRFSGRSVLWAGVTPCDGLMVLRQRLVAVLEQAGLPHDTKRFRPHVTLARCKQGVPQSRIARFLKQHEAFLLGPIRFDAFVLYSSDTRPEGAVYQCEQIYPLTDTDSPILPDSRT
ncbi:RNA 2',3'-cyclic phosphodiesterase [Sedimenticola sp.]|uniref:RNA 2',3'-cyclic phosphodiesterase n=1 Tax=Sedimenticola sp. TaxID=1940285 RepID=UPI003D126889